MRGGQPNCYPTFLWLVSSSTLWMRSGIQWVTASQHGVVPGSDGLRDTAEAGGSEPALSALVKDIEDNTEAEELAEASGAKMCPDLDDDNGRWEGSKLVGGKYKLTCAPGFKVQGHGNASTVLTCPPSLKWAQDVWCENIDDCAKLKHGCGPLGVCHDLVKGYECNCEQGYGKKHVLDGEIVCGSKHLNREICGGHTCGAYGVCIELQGDPHVFGTVKHEKKLHGSHEKGKSERKKDNSQHEKGDGSSSVTDAYRCECTDGFKDDGQTCVRLDCGKMVDPMGVWEGNTQYGGEYTLTCPESSFVWGGSLNEVTISCPTKGVWLSKPKCISPIREALDAEFATFRFWTFVFFALICVASAAAAAGLTLGVATLEPFKLNLIRETNSEECEEGEREKLRHDKAYADNLRAVVRGDHRLMVTLFTFNTIANEALPIFLDQLTSAFVSVLLSVSVVLIFGEILPSAVCTGSNQFYIAAKSVPFVKTLEFVFCPVAKPIGKLLDRVLETSDSFQKYRRPELRALFQLHVKEDNGQEPSDGPPKDKHLSERSIGSANGDKDHQKLPPLSTSELRIMENMWDLAERPLQMPRPRSSSRQSQRDSPASGSRPGFRYRSVDECLKVHAEDTSINVLARHLPFKVKPCAVLVLNSEISRTGLPDLQEKPVLADSVNGILHPRELLSGGEEPLHKLHKRLSGGQEPVASYPPMIDEEATLFEVLKALGTSSFGIVVAKTGTGRGRSEVKGVVCKSEVLGSLVLNKAGERKTTKGFTVSFDDVAEEISGQLLTQVNLRCTRGVRSLNRNPSIQLNRTTSPPREREQPPVSGGVFDSTPLANTTNAGASSASYHPISVDAWREPMEPIV